MEVVTEKTGGFLRTMVERGNGLHLAPCIDMQNETLLLSIETVAEESQRERASG
jgi:hypothetical protein